MLNLRENILVDSELGSYSCDLAKGIVQVVETPVLVMSSEIIREKYQQLRTELRDAAIFYAVKANPHEDIIRHLERFGAGFEITSNGELDLLIRLDIPPKKIISSNPTKDQGFIKMAHAYGVRVFAFDSWEEVEKLSKYAPGSKVYIRISVSNDGSEWPLHRKYGVEVEDALDLLLEARNHGLDPCGITFHIGSQCTNPDAWAEALRKSAVLWSLAMSKGMEVFSLNIGGGFPIRYTRPVPTIKEVTAVIKDTLMEVFPKGIELIVEPGRFIVGEAGLLITKVIGKAMRDGQKWLYLDVGVFNGLMETVGGIKYPFSVSKEGQLGKFVLAGPSCDGFDVISEEVELPEPQIGDRVYIKSAGAYTTAYASNFCGFSTPKTILT
jgi:ornithine decarboxylase